MNVAAFRGASLQAQLAELKRERTMRDKVYPHLIATRKLTEHEAAYQNMCRDSATATLARLVAADLRGEPGRKELVDLLRDVRRQARGEEVPGLQNRLDAVLERIPE